MSCARASAAVWSKPMPSMFTMVQSAPASTRAFDIDRSPFSTAAINGGNPCPCARDA